MRLLACLLVLLIDVTTVYNAAAQADFKLKSFEMPLPESGTVTGCSVDLGTNKVIFRPPFEWQLKTESTEKRVTMTHPERKAAIVMQFVPEATGKKPEIALDKLKEKVAARFQDGKIAEEYLFHSGAGPAQSFNIDRGTNANARLTSRCAFLPIEGYMVEFTITCSSTQSTQFHHSFANLLSSFTLEQLKPQTPPK